MYKLVPVEPTEEMVVNASIHSSMYHVYPAMLDAAPNPWRPISEAEEYKTGRKLLARWPHPTREHVAIIWWNLAFGFWEDMFGKVHLQGLEFIPLEWLGKPEDGQ